MSETSFKFAHGMWQEANKVVTLCGQGKVTTQNLAYCLLPIVDQAKGIFQ